jgi:hypothetical protein
VRAAARVLHPGAGVEGGVGPDQVEDETVQARTSIAADGGDLTTQPVRRVTARWRAPAAARLGQRRSRWWSGRPNFLIPVVIIKALSSGRNSLALGKHKQHFQSLLLRIDYRYL